MSSPLRFGIVGSGLIAGLIAQVIAQTEGAQVSAVASRRPANAAAFAERFAIPHVYAAWEELVASPHVDAVYVATPTHVREAIAVAAAGQGRHVLADKPFLSLASLQAITAACRAQGVAFMDATHFVHHPRSARLKAELPERVGPVQALHSVFCFPVALDGENIRFDPAQEPMGAIGDMVWYNMRAIVEYMAPEAPPLQVVAHHVRHPQTGAVIRGSGLMLFSGDRVATWTGGYDMGTLTMSLELLGPRGLVTLDDFVLTWADGIGEGEPTGPSQFVHRAGVANPTRAETVVAPGPWQAQRLVEDFLLLADDPTGPAQEASIRASEATQALVDAAWAAGGG